jgi:urea transport system ATP-binding protein
VQRDVNKTDLNEPVLAIRNLEVSFDGFKALDGVNFSVWDGELRVLIGANGAGKSTLLDIICGKTPATGGQVIFRRQEITNSSEAAIARIGIGRKFQTPTIFGSLTVLQNLEVARRQSYGVLANLATRVSQNADARIRTVLDRVGLADQANNRAAELSHGQKQWLELGMLLLQDPHVLLLDEPTAGMTAAETEHTAQIIANLKGDHTVIVVEHDMSFVRRICETITVLHQGKVLAEGNAGEIERNERVIEAYLGSSGVAHA